MKKLRLLSLIAVAMTVTSCGAGGGSGTPSLEPQGSSTPASSSETETSSADFASSDEETVSSETLESSEAPVSSEAEPTSSLAPISSEQESSSMSPVQSSEEAGFQWNMDLSLFGESFLVSLGAKINATRTKTISYSECLSEGAKAAAYPNENSSTFIPFYHEAKDSEKTTVGSCNREHTWPNSRGGGDKQGGKNIEKDPIMVRPTLSSDNSDRQNYFYGNDVYTSKDWDPASCGYDGARGESARVIFYVVTCYAKTNGLSLSNNPNDANNKRTMGTLKTLLQWNRDYPPTDFERTVNERYAKRGHARNAFVDHPEYADYIYDKDGFRTSAYTQD